MFTSGKVKSHPQKLIQEQVPTLDPQIPSPKHTASLRVYIFNNTFIPPLIKEKKKSCARAARARMANLGVFLVCLCVCLCFQKPSRKVSPTVFTFVDRLPFSRHWGFRAKRSGLCGGVEGQTWMFWGFVGYLPGVRRQNSCAWGSQCHEMAAALGLASRCF